ncbi:hypothetical protein NQ317_009507 [Molorchus minor]|uniref:Uncharacterized protein n=1 Tax=Molorchus minor TaxID=1323400 RepID=A0ABQ9J3X4_9CUCU|nr:hypothetical protein NQ317_009507 [Molorchus minor]
MHKDFIKQQQVIDYSEILRVYCNKVILGVFYLVVTPMKWLGVGEGDGLIKVEMDRGPHRSQDDAAVGYVFQRPPDPEFPSFGPKQLRWAHGDDSIIENHDKWKYPMVNNKVATPPNSMSYIGQNTPMPGLYDMGQNKTIPPEHLVYMSNQIPGGMALHPQQYLPQSLTQQLQPMRHQQQEVAALSNALKE